MMVKKLTTNKKTHTNCWQSRVQIEPSLHLWFGSVIHRCDGSVWTQTNHRFPATVDMRRGPRAPERGTRLPGRITGSIQDPRFKCSSMFIRFHSRVSPKLTMHFFGKYFFKLRNQYFFSGSNCHSILPVNFYEIHPEIKSKGTYT